MIWKNYSVDNEPAVVGQNRVTAHQFTLHPGRRSGTARPSISNAGSCTLGSGENYTSPADGNSDAIIAFDMEDRRKTLGQPADPQRCLERGLPVCYTEDDANCPAEDGPDYDFAASSILVTLEDGREFLVAGQKSGHVAGIDPENGQTLWKTPVGRGGIQGGVLFGMAAEGGRVYVPISDMFYPEDLDALQIQNPGQTRPLRHQCRNGCLVVVRTGAGRVRRPEYCDPGIGQAITAIPGAVIAGHFDGRLRIYSVRTANCCGN